MVPLQQEPYCLGCIGPLQLAIRGVTVNPAYPGHSLTQRPHILGLVGSTRPQIAECWNPETSCLDVLWILSRTPKGPSISCPLNWSAKSGLG